MGNCKTRLLISYILNLIMIILFISSIINEIVDIHTNPDSVYQTVWGLFRYFTIDGNLLSCIFNFIILINKIKALRIQNEKDIKEKTISHILLLMEIYYLVFLILLFLLNNTKH